MENKNKDQILKWACFNTILRKYFSYICVSNFFNKVPWNQCYLMIEQCFPIVGSRRTTAEQEVLALIAPLGKLIVMH